jgi:dephospho-CoA kinase
MILGLTGGIASGKTTVSKMIVEAAVRHQIPVAVIHADDISRQLLAPGSPRSRDVIIHFGKEVLGAEAGEIDRAALAKIVFFNKSERTWLEHLLHPYIIDQLAIMGAPYRLTPVRSGESHPLVVMEIPLLFELGLKRMTDKVVAVNCSREDQIIRFRTRQPMLSDAEIEARVDSQIPNEEKARKADFVINSAGSIADTLTEVEALIVRLIDKE